MKPTSTNFPFKAGALLGFLAMAVVGWNLAATSMPATKDPISREPTTRRAERGTRRSKTTGPGTLAGQKLDSIRAAGTQQARLSATIALANSLSPSEIAAWLEGGWFNIRSGPERILFRNILLARWRETDPEAMLVWSFKNDQSAAQPVLAAWAETEPQRLIEFFKSHPDPAAELRSLHSVAKAHPALALQRLQEMATEGMSSSEVSNSFSLFYLLAGKSPAALEAILDSLPMPMRNQAEAALCGQRLAASFATEIRALWDRPGGWEIFQSNLSQSPALRGKLFDELANMPPAWRALVAESYYYFTRGEEAKKWLDADLESLGFTAAQSKKFRAQALQGISYEQPEEAIKRMGEIELDANTRQNLISNMFSNLGNNPEKAEGLLALLTTEEDRKLAQSTLEARQIGQAGGKTTSPASWLEKVGGMDPKLAGNSSEYFQMLEQWDAGKISELSQQFAAMPDDTKQKAAQVIAAGRSYQSPTPFAGEAIRYLVVNPVARQEGESNSNTDPVQLASVYASQLAIKDPDAASDWVGNLPAGDAKLWAQKNMARNWAIYDPKAAAQWAAALPVEARSAVQAFLKKGE